MIQCHKAVTTVHSEHCEGTKVNDSRALQFKSILLPKDPHQINCHLNGLIGCPFWKAETFMWNSLGSGTQALLLPLWALAVLEGDVCPFSFFFFFAALNHPHKDLLKLKLLKLKPNQSVNLELGPLLCWPWRCTVNCLLGCGSSSPAGQLGFPCFSLYVDCFSSPTCSPCIAGLSVTILLPSLSHQNVPFNFAHF